MSDYVRLCTDLSDKGRLIKIDNGDLSEVYNSISLEKDAYTSVYYFNEEHNQIFKDKGTIAGITDVFGTKLFWDYDCQKNVEQARLDACEMYLRLTNSGFPADSIQIYFSGNKGFEMSIQLKDTKLTPFQVKNICLSVAKGLTTVDPVIYNATRIMRLPLTRHQKSGLYKIPLSSEELFSLSVPEIMTIAKETMTYADIKTAWKTTKLPKALEDMKNKTPEVKVNKELQKALSLDTTEIDWSLKPKMFSPEKYLISLGYFEEGNRSHALMILASTLKNAGFNETHAHHFLKAAAELQSKRTGSEKFTKEQISNTIISQVYGPNWLGGTYSIAEDFLLKALSEFVPDYIKTQTSSDVLNIEQSFDSFVSYAEDIDKNTLLTGIEILDQKLHIQVGRLYGILGSPGVGKTSVAITLLNNTSKTNEYSMFFSYDMSKPDIIQKLIQRHTRLSRTPLYEPFKSKNKEKQLQFKEILKDNYSKCTFVFKTGQTIEDIKNTIIDSEKKLGVNIRLIVVDYLELIQSRFSDPTQASMECIQGLREIAINLNKAVVVMLQPSKAGGSIDEPITSYNSAKGSSSIAQSVSAMLTVHRPGYSSRTPETDKYFSIDCVKNRSGSLFSCDLSWDGLTGTIRPLEKIEMVQLKDLRESKKRDKMEEDDNY